MDHEQGHGDAGLGREDRSAAADDATPEGSLEDPEDPGTLELVELRESQGDTDLKPEDFPDHVGSDKDPPLGEPAEAGDPGSIELEEFLGNEDPPSRTGG